MNIIFDSSFIQEETPNQIKFEAKLLKNEIDDKNQKYTYAFNDPSNNSLFEIEINKNTMKIISRIEEQANTLNLELNKKLKSEISVSSDNVIEIESLLTMLKNEKNKHLFKYELFLNNQNIGKFDISLTIKK